MVVVEKEPRGRSVCILAKLLRDEQSGLGPKTVSGQQPAALHAAPFSEVGRAVSLSGNLSSLLSFFFFHVFSVPVLLLGLLLDRHY